MKEGGKRMKTNKKVQCSSCDNLFSEKRQRLGYETCLSCGEKQATIDAKRKSKCFAPAYNKGAYMYITSKKMAKNVGR
mgnify:CR=1